MSVREEPNALRRHDEGGSVRLGEIVEVLPGLAGVEAVGVPVEEAGQCVSGRDEILSDEMLSILVFVAVGILELTHPQLGKFVQRLYAAVRVRIPGIQLDQGLGALEVIRNQIGLGQQEIVAQSLVAAELVEQIVHLLFIVEAVRIKHDKAGQVLAGPVTPAAVLLADQDVELVDASLKLSQLARRHDRRR